jgi:hypothetical protein
LSTFSIQEFSDIVLFLEVDDLDGTGETDSCLFLVLFLLNLFPSDGFFFIFLEGDSSIRGIFFLYKRHFGKVLIAELSTTGGIGGSA